MSLCEYTVWKFSSDAGALIRYWTPYFSLVDCLLRALFLFFLCKILKQHTCIIASLVNCRCKLVNFINFIHNVSQQRHRHTDQKKLGGWDYLAQDRQKLSDFICLKISTSGKTTCSLCVCSKGILRVCALQNQYYPFKTGIDAELHDPISRVSNKNSQLSPFFKNVWGGGCAASHAYEQCFPHKISTLCAISWYVQYDVLDAT